MNNRHFQKLARWLTLESEGLDNPALRQQLDSVVVKRHRTASGVRIIITLPAPAVLPSGDRQGKTSMAMRTAPWCSSATMAKIYGPWWPTCMPITFRPWVISNMMEKEAIVEHIYQGTMVRQRWFAGR